MPLIWKSMFRFLCVKGYMKGACLRRSIFFWFQSVFMHDPICFHSIRCPPMVENQRLPHAYKPCFIIDRFVSASCFPEPSRSCPISSRTSWIFLVFVTKEIPFFLLFIADPTPFCSVHIIQRKKITKGNLDGKYCCTSAMSINQHALHEQTDVWRITIRDCNHKG